MLWVTEMLVRDRIARFHAEAEQDRRVRVLTTSVSSGRPPRRRGGAWWQRLMGLRIRVSRQAAAPA